MGGLSLRRRPGTQLLRLFPAFESHDFRLLWVTNILGAGGMAMGMIAQGWLVLTVTDSAFLVGAVAGVRGVGVVAFGALGGVMADRWDRRHILMGAQVTRAMSALVLGVLTVWGRCCYGTSSWRASGGPALCRCYSFTYGIRWRRQRRDLCGVT